MKKNRIFFLLLFSFFFLLQTILTERAFGEKELDDIFVKAGIQLFEQNLYDQAILKFNKALVENPNNPKALYYKEISEMKYGTEEETSFDPEAHLDFYSKKQKSVPQETFESAKKEDWDDPKTLDEPVVSSVTSASSIDSPRITYSTMSPEKSSSPSPLTSISGEMIMRIGYDASRNDFYWKRANFDLNEKNWRLISSDGLNRRINTYDPAVFSRLAFDIDVDLADLPLNFHANITIDPWSFTGKTDKVEISSGSDTAIVQYFYAANTLYTFPQGGYSQLSGDLISLPEIKLSGKKVPAHTLISRFGGIYPVDDLKLKYNFQPIRELWMDYKPDENLKVTLFPFALQDKALTSDDPLGISNRHIWWAESPWLSGWRQGHYNVPPAPHDPDFFKGYWDNSFAFNTRDSDGRRLTALRGLSLEYAEGPTSFQATLASPKHLWQDYDTFDAMPGSMRLKHFIDDHLYVATTNNIHMGFANSSVDSYSAVTSYDAGIMLSSNLKLTAQYSFSFLEQDRTNSYYESQKKGNAYDLMFIGSSHSVDSPDKNYFAIRPADGDFFFKTRLRMTRMDTNYQTSLSSYGPTSQDAFWSRHITFREPMFFHDPGSLKKAITFYDIEPFAIGDSIDYGRYVANWRTDFSLFDNQLTGTTDIRNAHQTNTNKYIETVGRLELGYQINDQLETKGLWIAHHLPKTTAGIDPFLKTRQGQPVINAAIPGGKDPSVYTMSLGLKYQMFDWLAWNGVWERTNDVTAGTDNFPRGILADGHVGTFFENEKKYRERIAFLYSQEYFPLPSYRFFNIFRTGIEIKPDEKITFYLDGTYNPFRWAGPIDDNMNHIGLSALYTPTKNFGLYAKYIWSRMNDINALVYDNEVVYRSHHNVSLEATYKFQDESHLSFLYGVGPNVNSGYASSTPYAAATTPVLDTQNVFRLFYTKKF